MTNVAEQKRCSASF